jgi:hypothetical protein
MGKESGDRLRGKKIDESHCEKIEKENARV